LLPVILSTGCATILTIALLWLNNVASDFYFVGIVSVFAGSFGSLFAAAFLIAMAEKYGRRFIADYLLVAISCIAMGAVFWPTYKIDPKLLFSSDPTERYTVEYRSSHGVLKGRGVETAASLGQERWASRVGGSLGCALIAGSIAVASLLRSRRALSASNST
jgi:hypothetical protein